MLVPNITDISWALIPHTLATLCNTVLTDVKSLHKWSCIIWYAIWLEVQWNKFQLIQTVNGHISNTWNIYLAFLWNILRNNNAQQQSKIMLSTIMCSMVTMVVGVASNVRCHALKLNWMHDMHMRLLKVLYDTWYWLEAASLILRWMLYYAWLLNGCIDEHGKCEHSIFCIVSKLHFWYLKMNACIMLDCVNDVVMSVMINFWAYYNVVINIWSCLKPVPLTFRWKMFITLDCFNDELMVLVKSLRSNIDFTMKFATLIFEQILCTMLDCYHASICKGNVKPGHTILLKQSMAWSGSEQLCYYICHFCTWQTIDKLSFRAHSFKNNSTKTIPWPLPLLHLIRSYQ